MTVESASFISGLVPAYPPGSDSISEGDDHLRLLKSVLQGTFPNANAAINGIHTGTSAPTAKTAGTVWYDTTVSNKVLKIYNGTGWTTLSTSPETDFKLLGATNVGWVLPTADGIADQYLKTDGGGNLDWATIVSPSSTVFKAVTHKICAASSYLRNTVYDDGAGSKDGDTGFTITHNKQSATSDLYVYVDFFCNFTSNFDNGAFQAYLQLMDQDAIPSKITNTTSNLQYIHLDDVAHSGNPNADFSTGYSRWFKVAAADCPDGTTGNNVFELYSKLTSDAASDGGTIVGPGSMMVLEIE